MEPYSQQCLVDWIRTQPMPLNEFWKGEWYTSF
jgi:hypothetical protein